MLSKVYSAAILGIDAYIVDVEVDIFNGLPGITMVGLPDTAVQESRERVKSAIKNSGLQFPIKRMTINFAPANTKKSGPIFDLAVATGILEASEQLDAPDLADFVLVGELSLDGGIRTVQGVLPFAIAAKEAGKKHILVPVKNAAEAALVKELNVYPVANLSEAIAVLQAPECAAKYTHQDPTETRASFQLDFSDIKGQNSAKRGLEIAAAGGHNVIMVGPPGSGKTMLARRLPGILPPMTFDEALETSKIYSISSKDSLEQGLLYQRPFRAPHHSISNAGLVGGSSHPKPGEVSLAHHGVLFLDELLEFKRPVLEVLRQPLEDGQVTISRAQQSLTYPSQFMFVASMNPCPCGYYGDPVKECECSVQSISRYWNKLSGPLLDRIDIHLEVPRLSSEELLYNPPSESSSAVQERISEARERQVQRLKDSPGSANAQMNAKDLEDFCHLDTPTKDLLNRSIQRLGLSGRAYTRILKVARTIADLDQTEGIALHHVAEAVQFRNIDRLSA